MAKKLYKITRNGSKVVYNLEGQAHARKTLERITDCLLSNNGSLRYRVEDRKADSRKILHLPTKTSDLYLIEPN